MTTTINLSAPSVDFIIEQGMTVEIPFNVRRNGEPFDLTDFTDLRLQVRRTFGTSTTLINATLANEKMQFTDRANGRFKLVLKPYDTSAIRFSALEEDEINAVYDIELQDADGDVYKGPKGTMTIRREVTR